MKKLRKWAKTFVNTSEEKIIKEEVPMQRHPFTARQMFHLKQRTLEKRITDYYRTSQDGETVIKLARLLQIRNELGTEEINQPCAELVRALYIKQAAAESLRYFFYFRSYFSQTEWQNLLLQFFPQVPVWHFQRLLGLMKQIALATRYSATVP
ncbi:hypothetical protein CF160_01740 [Enterococcus pseudoavium]|nr:hypothetical protein CF160_01740 [Enterococcus pseudoavium]